jgi:hypothetical protein
VNSLGAAPTEICAQERLDLKQAQFPQQTVLCDSGADCIEDVQDISPKISQTQKRTVCYGICLFNGIWFSYDKFGNPSGSLLFFAE